MSFTRSLEFNYALFSFAASQHSSCHPDCTINQHRPSYIAMLAIRYIVYAQDTSFREERRDDKLQNA